jgi:hypothetical protein
LGRIPRAPTLLGPDSLGRYVFECLSGLGESQGRSDALDPAASPPPYSPSHADDRHDLDHDDDRHDRGAAGLGTPDSRKSESPAPLRERGFLFVLKRMVGG